MQCAVHGIQRQTLICQHLQRSVGLGFYLKESGSEEEMPWLKQAWCKACNDMLHEEGEWNERSGSFVKPLYICEGCFNDIVEQNELIARQ